MNLVISSSLNSESNSRLLAREALRVLQAEGAGGEWLDLRDHPLPLCDGGSAFGHPNVAWVRDRIAAADVIILATPIYNYDANAAVKNLIELTDHAWDNKVVGFLCAAGGRGSYMSILPLANSLMLNFRTVIVPRFVYATSAAFATGEIVDTGIRQRVADLARSAARLGGHAKAA